MFQVNYCTQEALNIGVGQFRSSVMPADVASYLISASPPGFSIPYSLLNDHFGIRSERKKNQNISKSGLCDQSQGDDQYIKNGRTQKLSTFVESNATVAPTCAEITNNVVSRQGFASFGYPFVNCNSGISSNKIDHGVKQDNKTKNLQRNSIAKDEAGKSHDFYFDEMDEFQIFDNEQVEQSSDESDDDDVIGCDRVPSCFAKVYLDDLDNNFERKKVLPHQNNRCSSTTSTIYYTYESKGNLKSKLRTRGIISRKELKKVSFADEVGLALTNVLIITESPDTPPRLPLNSILSSLSEGNCPPTRPSSSCYVPKPTLSLSFSQPASEYLQFREKVEKYCVSLENCILKDDTIKGTIKVKNIAFEKIVFVRCTFDGWSSHSDYYAKYVPTRGICSVFDTFSFLIDIPADALHFRCRIEFSICYEVASSQYWDSNNGSNYEIQAKEANQETVDDCAVDEAINPTLTPRDFDGNWSEYVSWKQTTVSQPYW